MKADDGKMKRSNAILYEGKENGKKERMGSKSNIE